MARPGFLSIDRIAHQASIVGRVGDGGGPLANVEVLIQDGPGAWKARLAALRQGRPDARPERATSDDHGFFRWLDLPPGTYQLEASLAGGRYTAASASATVTGNAPASVDLTLGATRLVGTVSADKPAGPLALARVRLVDSGETAFTATDGTFALAPVEPGTNRTLEVSAQRYLTTTQAVTLARGQTTTATITLTHS